ncbi:hypothetical protein B0H17DRAFT_1194565 [Mycena rosella]|uniref:Uncharacterized protein n=1 Tax=Mycena rosella TaxID=1033263 RepID=A0AAD7GQY5_MYCRO|nr:hypothetical protein B0H17DRAFT_1194565 [Mycena rosella]
MSTSSASTDPFADPSPTNDALLNSIPMNGHPHRHVALAALALQQAQRALSATLTAPQTQIVSNAAAARLCRTLRTHIVVQQAQLAAAAAEREILLRQVARLEAESARQRQMGALWEVLADLRASNGMLEDRALNLERRVFQLEAQVQSYRLATFGLAPRHDAAAYPLSSESSSYRHASIIINAPHPPAYTNPTAFPIVDRPFTLQDVPRKRARRDESPGAA